MMPEMSDCFLVRCLFLYGVQLGLAFTAEGWAAVSRSTLKYACG